MRISPVAVSISLFLACQGAPGQTGGPGSVSRVLGPLARGQARPQVLILATPHLRTLGERFQPSAAKQLDALLDGFRPDTVCVEFLPPAAVAGLEAQGGTGAEIAEAFAKPALDWGRLLRKQSGETRDQAAARAEEMLARQTGLSAEERIRLVAELLAAYDYPSALLQWFYVPEETRQNTTLLPEEVRKGLEADLRAPSETAAVSIPVARRRGLGRLVSIDDHFDDERLQLVPEAEIRALMADPRAQAAAGAELYKNLDKRLSAANAAGDFLPVYRYVNSPSYLSRDVDTQWAVFLRMRLSSGVDRYRYALWEARNMKIAANIAAAASERGSARILVVIGAAHKPFLEEDLGRLVSMRLANLAELEPTR